MTNEEEVDLREVMYRARIPEHPNGTCDVDWRCALAENRINEQSHGTRVFGERWHEDEDALSRHMGRNVSDRPALGAIAELQTHGMSEPSDLDLVRLCCPREIWLDDLYPCACVLCMSIALPSSDARPAGVTHV